MPEPTPGFGQSADRCSATRATAGSAHSAQQSEDRPAAGPNVEIKLDAGIFLLAALGCIAALVAVGLLVAHLGYGRETGLPDVILRGFLLDEEANIPTFFAFSLLVLCSALLALIGVRAILAQRAFRFRWTLLAASFLFFAFDEAASVHERLIVPLRTAFDAMGFDATGWTYFAWVIPAWGIVAMMALFYLPFLRGLPEPCGRLFVLSGVLYVGGAVGVEMPGGAYYEAYGKQNFTYQLITTVEETLEMLGLTVFAYALMRYLGRGNRSVRIAVWAG